MDCCAVYRNKAISLHEACKLVEKPIGTVVDKFDQIVEIVKAESSGPSTERATRLDDVTSSPKALADVIESAPREVEAIKGVMKGWETTLEHSVFHTRQDFSIGHCRCRGELVIIEDDSY